MDDFQVEPGARRGSPIRNPSAPGSGWYESSWDLLRGLEVREVLPADATPGDWLELAAPFKKE